VSCSDSWWLKLVREISVSSFRDFCSSFQSLAAENWKERRPKEELVLGVTREIYLGSLMVCSVGCVCEQSPRTSWKRGLISVGEVLCFGMILIALFWIWIISIKSF
jgi:hypothetical protein